MEKLKEYFSGLYDLTEGEKERKAKRNVTRLLQDGCNIQMTNTMLELIDLVLIPIKRVD